MRTISVRNSPAFDSIMVVSNDQGAVHRYPTRVWGANANFQAAVPLLGKYTVTFEDAAGNPSWPGYARMGITGRLPSCANHITESDVTLVMPDTIAAGQCSSMTVNGDFNDGRRGWDHSWFPFRVNSEELATGELNYFLETTKMKLMRSNIYTWLGGFQLRQAWSYLSFHWQVPFEGS
jgi:hypothetical protein